MKFKTPQMQAQYNRLPEKMKEICEYFCTLSEEHLVDPLVTRVADPVEGESGVHPQYRAVDFRNQHSNGKNTIWLYSDETVEEIVNAVNEKFPRNDGKKTCIHHSFKGGAFHFHLQCMATWVTKEEYERLNSSEDH